MPQRAASSLPYSLDILSDFQNASAVLPLSEPDEIAGRLAISRSSVFRCLREARTPALLHRACRYVGPVGSEPGFGFKVGVAERVYLLNTKVTYMTYIPT